MSALIDSRSFTNRRNSVRLFLPIVFASVIAAQASTVALAQCFDWVQRPGSYQPSQGSSSAMTFDSTRGCVVLFGWQNGTPPGPTTWLWGGTSWVRCLPANQPANRYNHAMTFDSRRGVVVLFGGSNGQSLDWGDTWEWDGYNWTVRSTTGPSPRQGHAMAYDSARAVVVLFGGTTSSGQPVGDTWEWDGSVWSQRVVTGPPAQHTHCMTFDEARSEVLLFSAWYNGPEPSELWKWDGVQWTQLLPDPAPPARTWAHLAYDSLRKVSVLYGGELANGLNQIAWEWDGNQWHERSSLVTPGIQSNDGNMAFDSRRNKIVLLNYPGTTWEYPASFAVQIIANPEGGTFCLGESVSLSVEASGDEPFSYRWLKNGNDYMASDSSSPTITFDSADFSHAGEYEVVVSNVCGEVTSACATVSICTGVGGCPSPLDLNADGVVNGSDVQRMVEVLLGG